MPGDIAYFVYMAIFGLVIGSYVLRSYRGRMGTMVQQALIWLLIFLAAVIIFGFKEQLQRQIFPAQATLNSDNTISLKRARDGHFYADMLANGVSVEFVIDTGASGIVLATQDAERIGIPLNKLVYLGIAETANGEVRTANATLDTLAFSGMRNQNVRVYVSEGRMSISLLGMDYLRRFERIEIVGDTLLLHR